MPGSQRLLAMAMAYSLTGTPGNGKAEVLGIVVQAEHASLGLQGVAEGTSVYDGDRLSTDSGGSLRLRIADALVYLTDQSSVIVRNEAANGPGEFEAELLAGTAVLSVKAGATGAIVARTARIRPISDTRGVVQVRLIGPNELLVFARRGAALISYRGDSETIAEGKTYRVLLNPSDDNPAGTASTKPPTKRNKALLIVAIGAAGAAGAALLWRGLEGGPKGIESPDRP